MKKVLFGLVLIVGTLMASNLDLKQCLGCHGQDWSKVALGESKVVSEMSREDIAAALKGYKAGTYGGPFKGLMKGQILRFSDEELDAIALEIAGEDKVATDTNSSVDTNSTSPKK